MNEAQAGIALGNRYLLIEKIGRGGMADVWLGEDQVLGRKVAVKIMSPQFAGDEEFSRRFKREAAASAHLQSPYIVNVYDWGHEDNLQYIVMEFVQGEDLKDLLVENGPVAPKKAAKIGIQVCHALSVAHQQDIIHRDIKPQNIMVQPDGNIKVMDFGIARAKNSTEQKTQVVLGTAHYVSPEQARGMELTAESDIYSLGIVLYEMVTGRVPFDGEEAVEVAMKQCNDQPVLPSYIVPNIDKQLEEIIMKALSKNPRQRFSTASEMGRALDDYVHERRSFSEAETRVIPPSQNVVNGGQTMVMPPQSNTATPQGGANSNTDGSDDNGKGSKKKRNIIIGCIAGGIVLIGIILAVVLGMNAPTKVPDLVGQTEAQAKVILEEAHLELGDVQEVPSAEIESGKIVASDPEAGVEVGKGTKVNIKISSGPQMVEVPDLSNMTEDEAKAALEEVGLKGKKESSAFSTDVPEGQVISQTPLAKTKAEAGSTISFVISSGAESVSVPDLSGLTEAEALAKLEEVGLNGLQGSKQPSETVEEGRIVSQNPSAGMKVDAGTQVTFAISTGKEAITVPSLIGFSQNSAKSTLINAGFVLGEVTEQYSDEPKGTVIKQSIEYGEKATRGTAIDIIISKGSAPANTNIGGGDNSNANMVQSGV